jgi:serine/threonine protein phosphatase PrpC
MNTSTGGFARKKQADEPPRPRRQFSVRSFGATDTGRVRPANEDQFLIAELTKTMTIAHTSLRGPSAVLGDERGQLFLVADGMGGHAAGERASELAVALIERFTVNTFKWFLQDDDPGPDNAASEFADAIDQADAAIIDESEANPELQGMGTTLTLAYAVGAQLFLLHVGDSRAYLFRAGALRQLTHDHTVVADMVRRGELQPEQASQHRLRHVITNVLGGRERGVRAEAHAVDLQADDELLLCSDGLTEMVNAGDITGVLSAEEEPERAARRLIDLANERGGHDNITVIVARFEQAEEANASEAAGAAEAR